MQNKNFTNQINEFYLASNEYCKLLENISSIPKFDFLSKVQKILTLVYLKASLVVKPEEKEQGEAEKFVQEADWEYIKQLVGKKLGLTDKFVEIELPENLDPENFESISLSECFADIYQDLRDFSTNFEIGNEEAIHVSFNECIDNFEKFWGIRVLAILSSIHNLIFGGELNEEEDTKTSENDSVNTNNWLINKRFDN